MPEIEIGKFTLESLTTGMYNNPEIVYREYIQNAVDSFDNAVSQKLMNVYLGFPIFLDAGFPRAADDGVEFARE